MLVMAMTSSSFEKSCGSPNSEDLRWQMLWQGETLGYTCTKIAENLCVGKSTVSQTLNLFQTTGSVSKRPYPKERAIRKLTASAQLLTFHLRPSRPGFYLRKIQDDV